MLLEIVIITIIIIIIVVVVVVVVVVPNGKKDKFEWKTLAPYIAPQLILCVANYNWHLKFYIFSHGTRHPDWQEPFNPKNPKKTSGVLNVFPFPANLKILFFKIEAIQEILHYIFGLGFHGTGWPVSAIGTGAVREKGQLQSDRRSSAFWARALIIDSTEGPTRKTWHCFSPWRFLRSFLARNFWVWLKYVHKNSINMLPAQDWTISPDSSPSGKDTRRQLGALSEVLGSGASMKLRKRSRSS